MPDISRRNKTTIRRVQGQPAPDEELNRSRVLHQINRVDWSIVICLVLLLAFGLVSLFSASMSASVFSGGGGTAFFVRQLSANLLGIFVIFILTKFNIKTFDRPVFAIISYFSILFLIGLTYFSTPINGSRRWLSIPIFGQFQPSELMKVVLVYSLAVYFSWLNKQRAAGRFPRVKGLKGAIKDTFHDLIVPAFIILIPAGVVLGQPHLSGMIILSLIGMVSLLAAGVPFRSWAVAIVTAISIILIGLFAFTISAPVLPQGIKDNFAHVEVRINVYLGNEEASEAAIYQSRQSEIAMGSGGLLGVGLGNGKQKNNYLPEGHNDYIFSNIVEESGFVGGMAVLGLFLVFFILGLRITVHATSVYAQIVAGGITSLIVIQALLNLGVNVGVIPSTGISLPFFSYGGTSNLFFLIGIGLLLNVSKYGVSRQRPIIGEGGLSDEQDRS